ncbi:hypothetical protein [Pelodictyon luteolum]|nr:hypothetical protein [Pelodictyon luteolum]
MLSLFLLAPVLPATAGATMVLSAVQSSGPQTSIDPGAFMMLFVVIGGVVAAPLPGKKTDAGSSLSAARLRVHRVDWQRIDRAACQGVLDGADGGLVNGMMRENDVRNVHQSRIALVMDALGRSSSPMLELYAVVENSYEWKGLVLKYFHEVCLLGYAEINERFASLTEKGSAVLEGARAEGFDPAYWGFMERRMHESVSAVCPHCGNTTHTHFFRDDYVCSGCSKRVRLQESEALILRCSDAHLRPRMAASQ